MYRFNALPIPMPVYSTEPGGGTGDGGQQQKPPGTTSLMGSKAPEGDGGGGGQQPPTVFPENWRDLVAGEEADFKTEAARYKTPQDMLKSLVETKKELRSRATLKEDPMPDVGDGKDEAKVEALKQWRNRHGIPDDPTGYKLPEDVTKRLLEVDKPMIEDFTKFAHSKGRDQSFVADATAWYVEAMEKEALREVATDKEDLKKAEDTLREEWQQGYRQNFEFAVNTAKQILGEQYNGMSIFEARLPNGMKLGSIPEFVKGMHQVGLAIYGDGSLVGDEAVKATESRKAEIRNIMATDFNKYINEGLDKEYQAIIEAESKKPQR